MKFNLIMAGAATLMMAACDMNAQNPDLLKGANFVANQPAATITLSFAPDEMRVNGQVVNLYNGAYTVDGNKIKFDGFASTMMMGEPDAMATETEYFQFMPMVETYELGDGILTLRAADGTEMVFTQVAELPTNAPAENTAD